MKLSFIVAAYNVGEYIQDCLNSILKLDLNFNYEIIVINDGSTDNTLVKIQEVIDGRIRVYTVDNSGISAVRNLGIKEAFGEYLYFVDGDDLINRYDFELIAKNLFNGYEIIIGGFNELNESNSLIANNQKNIKLIDIGKNILSRFFLRDITPSIWKCFFKSDVIKSNQIYFIKNISMAEDGEWFLRILYYSNLVMYDNNLKIYNYRLRRGSAMLSKYTYQKFADVLQVINEINNTVRIKSISNEDRKIFDLYACSLLYNTIVMYDDFINEDDFYKIKSLIKEIKFTNLKSIIFLSLMRLNTEKAIFIFKKYYANSNFK